MKRRLTTLGLVVAASLATWVSIVPGMHAANGVANCANTIDNRHSGSFPADPLAVTGYYAHIDSQTVYLCTNQIIGGHYASVGLANIQDSSCGTCANSIVQIGRGACREPNSDDCTGPSMRLFVAYGRDPAATGCAGQTTIMPVPLNRGPAPTDTGLHYYRVWTDGTRWNFDHWPKGQSVVHAFDISASLICWTQREGLVFTEAVDFGDANGGGPTNHFNFLSMTRQSTVGGAWAASNSTACFIEINGIPAGDNCQFNASQSVETWTNR